AFVVDKNLEARKLIPVLERGVKFLRRIDRYIKPRLTALTTGALINRLNGLALMTSGILLMLPLSFIPFSNTIPGVAILMLSSGISQRDGLLVILGYLLMVATMLYFCAIAYAAY